MKLRLMILEFKSAFSFTLRTEPKRTISFLFKITENNYDQGVKILCFENNEFPFECSGVLVSFSILSFYRWLRQNPP